jgi:hypothetical protein
MVFKGVHNAVSQLVQAVAEGVVVAWAHRREHTTLVCVAGD